MRGGNSIDSAWLLAVRGLSPHARGKRVKPAMSRASLGSIPACAGETLYGYGGKADLGVYPRMRGGNYQSPSLS